MDNEVPILAPLFFSAFMAVMAFIYIRYAERLKYWQDNYALFEFQRRINRAYTASAYRNCGWFLAAGSVLMLFVALFIFFSE